MSLLLLAYSNLYIILKAVHMLFFSHMIHSCFNVMFMVLWEGLLNEKMMIYLLINIKAVLDK